MFPRYGDTRGMDHMRLHPARPKPARQPEAVPTSFEGQCNPRDLAAGLDRLVAPAMQQASSRSGLGSSFLRGWRSMPGSIPATSQLDWLISTTAMIVLSWSRATRDLLKSFGWGIGALHQLDAATMVPFPRRLPHSISLSPPSEQVHLSRRWEEVEFEHLVPGFAEQRVEHRACSFGAKAAAVQRDFFCASNHSTEPG